MNRRQIMALVLAAIVVPGATRAQGITDSVVAQLRAQGFQNISVSNTLLGRTRILATSSDGSREIIIDPRTGEILRDLWQGRGGGLGIVDDRGGSGRDRSREDDDDDHGSSGSGGGGGNSGSGGGGDDDDDDDDDKGDND